MSLCDIRVEGRVDPRWLACLDGLAITNHDDGSTTLRGALTGVEALRTVLLLLSTLGLPVLTVRRLPPDAPSSLSPVLKPDASPSLGVLS